MIIAIVATGKANHQFWINTNIVTKPIPKVAPTTGINPEIPMIMANKKANGTFKNKNIGVRAMTINSPSNNWLKKKFWKFNSKDLLKGIPILDGNKLINPDQT